MAMIYFALRNAQYVSIALLLAGILWYRSSAEDAEQIIKNKDLELSRVIETNEAKVSKLMEANESQAESLNRLNAQRALDDATVYGLASKLSEIRISDYELAESITQVGREDENVKAYLFSPVPAKLRELLNRRNPVK